MTSENKVYPFGVNIYIEKGELKTSMTDAVKSVVYTAFPDLDDRRDAILTERLARLVKLKAALDNMEHFANLSLDFYESIQRTGHEDLMAMFTPRNVVIFHSSIRILTANTIDKLLAVAELDERLAIVELMLDYEEQVRADNDDEDDEMLGDDFSFGDEPTMLDELGVSDDEPTFH